MGASGHGRHLLRRRGHGLSTTAGARPASARLEPAEYSALAKLYAKNRRDGARLLSSALVITTMGLVRIDHPIGQVVGLLGALVCLYWWSCYRSLER